MKGVPISEQSVYAKQMWDRVKFTEEQVVPYAREAMAQNFALKIQTRSSPRCDYFRSSAAKMKLTH